MDGVYAFLLWTAFVGAICFGAVWGSSDEMHSLR